MNLPELIYQSFQAEKKEPKKQDVITFAPSYLSKCGRAIYYSKSGTPESNPPDLPALLKMNWGDLLHDNLQAFFSAKGILESFEEHRQTIYDGLTFNYFYDGILKQDDYRAILEIKTVYASGYTTIADKPKDDHVLQCLSYMIFENIDKGIILYAGRDNGYLVQYKLHFDGENCYLDGNKTDYFQQWKSKIDRLKSLKVEIESGQMPKRDFSIVLKNNGTELLEQFVKDKEKYKSHWACNYCSFKDLCWKAELEQIKQHKFYINNLFS